MDEITVSDTRRLINIYIPYRQKKKIIKMGVMRKMHFTKQLIFSKNCISHAFFYFYIPLAWRGKRGRETDYE